MNMAKYTSDAFYLLVVINERKKKNKTTELKISKEERDQEIVKELGDERGHWFRRHEIEASNRFHKGRKI